MENISTTYFNYFDIIISIIILLLAIKGFINGFIKEVFGLIGLIGGIYFASRLSDAAADFIDQNFMHLENLSLLKLIGFLAILLIIWLGATIIGSIFSRLSNATGLGFFNRLFGFIVGGGKYFLVFALITTALSNVTLVQESLTKHVEGSFLYPYLKKYGKTLINMDPKLVGIQSKSTIEVAKEIINLEEVNTTSSSTSNHIK